MSVGLTLTDRAGRIVFANRAEAAMHGYEPEELIGMPSRLLGVTGDARPPSPAALVNTPWGRQRLNRRRGGDVFPVRLVSDDVRDESGRVLGRITVCEDVTERARLDRMQEEFVTVVSHELRTPLTSILGCLALLRNDQSPPERSAEALAIAERNGRLLLTLVSDLLDLERAVSGALEIDLTAVPVAGVLREAARRAEGSAGQAGSESAPSRIVIDLDGLDRAPGATEATVRADRERLLQALGHLLSNALKFSPAGSPVRLAARRGPDHTTLVVADQGPGIPEEFPHPVVRAVPPGRRLQDPARRGHRPRPGAGARPDRTHGRTPRSRGRSGRRRHRSGHHPAPPPPQRLTRPPPAGRPPSRSGQSRPAFDPPFPRCGNSDLSSVICLVISAAHTHRRHGGDDASHQDSRPGGDR